MRHLVRPLVVVLVIGVVTFLLGCGGGGGGGGGESVGPNQIAVRNFNFVDTNITADIRAAAAALPATAKVSLYQNGVLVSGPQDMGANGVVFTGLYDGTYSVRVLAGGRYFQTTKTVNSARRALIARVTYFNTSGVGIKFEEIVDSNGDSFVGAGENVAKNEFSAGATSEAAIGDAVDVTNWSVDLLVDTDNDGLLNAFDEDVDGDGTLNSDDSDIDNDGSVNGSDDDIDDDGVLNPQDTQPSGAGTTVELFPAPNGFQTAGFPAVSTTLQIPNFVSPKRSAVVLINTTGAALNVTVSANGAGIVTNQVMANQVVLNERDNSEYEKNLARLRAIGRTLPKFEKTSAKLSIRANRAALNDTRTFYNGMETKSVTASLKNIYAATNGAPGLEHWVSNEITGTDLTTLQNHISQVNTLWSTSNQIYKKVTETFGLDPSGSWNGLNLPTTMTILWLKPYLNYAGFFNSADLYPKSQDANSNETKMVYLYFDSGAEALFNYGSTLAHELQHMINFVQRKNLGLNEDAWLDEAMSGYAEHVAGYSIVSENNASKARLVRDFLGNPQSNNLIEWSGSTSDYGQVALFGLWLAEKYGSSGSVKTLLTQTTVGSTAVSAFSGGIAFGELVKTWQLALYINDTTGATKYGYTNFSLRNTYSGVTLSGPANARVGTINVARYAAAYVEVSAPTTATTLTWTVPSTLSVFELNKNW